MKYDFLKNRITRRARKSVVHGLKSKLLRRFELLEPRTLLAANPLVSDDASSVDEATAADQEQQWLRIVEELKAKQDHVLPGEPEGESSADLTLRPSSGSNVADPPANILDPSAPVVSSPIQQPAAPSDHSPSSLPAFSPPRQTITDLTLSSSSQSGDTSTASLASAIAVGEDRQSRPSTIETASALPTVSLSPQSAFSTALSTNRDNLLDAVTEFGGGQDLRPWSGTLLAGQTPAVKSALAAEFRLASNLFATEFVSLDAEASMFGDWLDRQATAAARTPGKAESMGAAVNPTGTSVTIGDVHRYDMDLRGTASHHDDVIAAINAEVASRYHLRAAYDSAVAESRGGEQSAAHANAPVHETPGIVQLGYGRALVPVDQPHGSTRLVNEPDAGSASRVALLKTDNGWARLQMLDIAVESTGRDQTVHADETVNTDDNAVAVDSKTELPADEATIDSDTQASNKNSGVVSAARAFVAGMFLRTRVPARRQKST